MPVTEPRTFHWTREEYDRLRHGEWFLGRRVQLIGGEILEYPPEPDWECAARTLASDALRAAFGKGFWVRERGSLDVGEDSVPDPDLAVVPGTPRDYVTRGTPRTALLVVEVADTTLAFDRGPKASLYAAGGIADYWVVNLVQRQFEVYRDPTADAAQPFGFHYRSRTILDPADTIAPLVAPQARITVADLLP